MNEADSPLINLDDLRLVPDWLREEPLSPSKQYAGHEGRDDSRPDRGGQRAPRREGFGSGRPAGPGGGRPGGRTDPRPSNGDRRSSPPRGNDRSGRPDDRRPFTSQASLPPVTPAPVKIDFLPEERCLANIVKQIRSSHMAYPLFGTARMFLREPERHLLRITLEATAVEAGSVLFQLDDNGPVAIDRQVLERIAFEAMKDRYYVEETAMKEPPKGNFTNVARCRLDGTLLGPTNFHGYQPALRALYDARYSRRMPFDAFRQSIEIVSDLALVDKWKNEANTVTTIVTREEEPKVILHSLSEARAHFRQYYLEKLLRQGNCFELPGSVARSLPEASMMMAIRQSNENEIRYPGQFVQHLRKGLQDAGLHIFKHRKRIVYVAVTRPTLFAGGAVSANVAAILEYVGQKPLCTRKELAGKFLSLYFQQPENVVKTEAATPLAAAANLEPELPITSAITEVLPLVSTGDSSANTGSIEGGETNEQQLIATSAPEITPVPERPAADPLMRAKTALAADLRFLLQAGHIIEFHDGTFDLPLSAKTKEELQPAGRSLPTPNPLFTGKRKAAQPAAPSPELVAPDMAEVTAPVVPTADLFEPIQSKQLEQGVNPEDSLSHCPDEPVKVVPAQDQSQGVEPVSDDSDRSEDIPPDTGLSVLGANQPSPHVDVAVPSETLVEILAKPVTDEASHEHLSVDGHSHDDSGTV